MSLLTLDMSSYEIHRSCLSSAASEVSNPEWVSQPALQSQSTPDNPVGLPPDLVAIDADVFLNRMYTYQHS